METVAGRGSFAGIVGLLCSAGEEAVFSTICWNLSLGESKAEDTR